MQARCVIGQPERLRAVWPLGEDTWPFALLCSQTSEDK